MPIQNPQSQGCKLLNVFTASGTPATLDCEDASGAYDGYLFVVHGARPVAASATFQVRAKIGGAYDVASNYYAGSNGTQWSLPNIAAANTAGFSVSGHILIPNALSTTLNLNGQAAMGYANATGGATFNGSIQNIVAGAFTGLRFFFSTGNISSLVVRMYGLQQA